MNTHDDPTTPTTGAGPTAADTPTATVPAGADPTATPDAPVEPTYLTGPAPFPLVLGLLGLLTALGVVLADLTDVSFPFRDLGPWTVVLVGAVIIVVGALGLRSSRGQD